MSKHDFETMRRAMVASQIRTVAVSDSRVVDAMEKVARETFVPAERASLAYVDLAVPLGHGRALNPPMATARLLNEARLQPSDRVLLVGAATGYTAAVLAELADHVVALESDADLAAVAKAQLKALGNVTVAQGPLDQGWAKGAPYSVVVVDGAVEHVPSALVDQLADHGRLVAALAEKGVIRLSLGMKAGTSFAMVPFAEADAAALPGFDLPKVFSF